MSYQNFQTINDALPEAVRTDFARAVIQAQSSADAVVSVATSTISEYARLYSQVQRLKYDTSGNVTDVTPMDELTVPASAIATLKQSMNDLRKLINWYETMGEEIAVDAKANIPGYYCNNTLNEIDKVTLFYGAGGSTATATLTAIAVSSDGNKGLFGWLYNPSYLPNWYQIQKISDVWYRAQVQDSSPGLDLHDLGGFIDPDNMRARYGHMDVNFAELSDLTSAGATQIGTGDVMDLLLSNVIPSYTGESHTVREYSVQSKAAEQVDVTATFDISQALRAVIAPYQRLIDAIDAL